MLAAMEKPKGPLPLLPLPAETAEVPEVWVDWQLAPPRPAERPGGRA